MVLPFLNGFLKRAAAIPSNIFVTVAQSGLNLSSEIYNGITYYWVVLYEMDSMEAITP